MGGFIMNYMVLIYGSEAAGMAMSEAEQATQMQEYYAFTNLVREKGVLVSGEALHPTSSATTIRVRDGKILTTDGPFAETKEQLGGYYIFNCKDLDEAIEYASKIPGGRDGSLEIRPIAVFN
jgi:hypothetical protein